MTVDQVNSLIRHLCTFGGAFLIAHGYKESGTLLGGEPIIGALVALSGFAWSMYHHGKTDTKSNP